MVPLYSVQSWFSLRYHQFALYIDTLRDLYEAFVIQSFLYYLVEILGGEDVLSRTLAEKGDSHHGEHGKFLGRFITQLVQVAVIHSFRDGVYLVLKSCFRCITLLALHWFNDLINE
jgi:hypothetical protein